MAYKYRTIICAGTFSPLHEGHAFFIQTACSLAEHVYLTITSDTYTAAHKPHALPFFKRKQDIEQFLAQKHLLERVTILPIDDVYGITLDSSLPLEALLVTDDTLQGGEAVNSRRAEKHLLPLFLELVQRKESEAGIPISSTLLRSGMIDKQGNLLIKKEVTNMTSLLPETFRTYLQEPIGSFLDESEIATVDPSHLITVGDVTTKKFHDKGIYPSLSIVDFVVERHAQHHSLKELGFLGTEEVLEVDNLAGTITPSLWQSIKKALSRISQKKIIIVVNGEEDLAVIPAILLCPLGYTVCYGQPHKGMVATSVTPDKKMQVLKLLDAFKQDSTRGH